MITMGVSIAMCCVYGIEKLTFGDWLAIERKKRGLKTAELAAMAGRSRVTVENIEKGRKGFYRDTVDALADALAGPDATDEEREAKRREARLAAAGALDIEPVRLPDEAILAQIESYDGENENLRGFSGFLRAKKNSKEVPPPPDVSPM